MATRVKIGKVKENMKHIYVDVKRRLDKVEMELAMKGAINGWLLAEYKKERELLVIRLNECIDEDN
tara:strand:- start:32872 stop:33069 length:198 start_codon:yes stop_codon:yes gene_type:complete